MADEDVAAELKLVRCLPRRELPHACPMMGGGERPLTPQLPERLVFTSSFIDIQWRFPSPAQLNRLSTSRALKAVFEAQWDNWAGSPPANLPPTQVSLLAVADLDNGDVVWLAWGATTQPEMWAFIGHAEARFANLRSFVLHLLSAR